jgi:hypothetical protein
MAQVINSFEIDASASFFFEEDLIHAQLIVQACDCLVVCRTRYSDGVNYLISLAQARGVKVLFDIDDFVFNADYVHLILSTLDQDFSHPNVWDFWFAYISRIGATLKLCDEAITTNEFLASEVVKFSSKPVHVIPNFLNKEQEFISKDIFSQKNKENFKRDENIHIGYFSGTPTHNKDFEIVTYALTQLMNKYEQLILRVAGYMELPSILDPYMTRIEIVPFQDFLSLQNCIGQTEINIVPLQNNIFTNCKSELKFFEASIVGTLSVASPLFVYNKLCESAPNTISLSNSFEWFQCLDRVIQKFDSNLFEETLLESYSFVCSKYLWSNQLSLIESAVFDMY